MSQIESKAIKKSSRTQSCQCMANDKAMDTSKRKTTPTIQNDRTIFGAIKRRAQLDDQATRQESELAANIEAVMHMTNDSLLKPRG